MTTGCFLMLSRVQTDTSIEAFVSQESEAQKALEEYRDLFGRDDLLVLMIEGDVFSRSYLERLEELHEALEKLDVEVESRGQRKSDREALRKTTDASKPDTPQAAPADDFGDFDDFGGEGWGDEAGGTVIEEVTSLINVRRTRATPDGEGIVVGSLMDPLPTAEELPALKAEVLADKVLVGQIVGRRGRHSLVVLRTDFMNEVDSIKVSDAVMAIGRRFETPDFQVSEVGLPALNSALNALMFTDLGRLGLLSASALFLLLAFIFRHPAGVVGPIAVVGMAVVTTFGYMAATGTYVTMLSTILPAFIACVGVGDSVHLLSVFRDYLREGLDREEAIVQAVATTGTPVVYTTPTTMIGLLSFRFASLEAIQDMGTAGAIGVAVAMVHSLVFLPIVLSFTRKTRLGAKPIGEKDVLDRFLNTCLDASGLRVDDGIGPEPPQARRRRHRTLLVGLVLIGVAGFGISLLNLYHNPFAWVPDGTPIKTAFETMDEEVGGTSNIQLLVTGTTDRGVKDKALLHGLETLQEHIQSFRHPTKGALVGSATSALDIIRETNRALHGGDQEHYAIPETQGGVNDAFFLFTNASPDELRRFATTDLSSTQMTLRIKWLSFQRGV